MRRYSTVKEDVFHLVTIDKIGLFGEGIAKIDQGLVFVPYAAVGETCEVKEVERRKHFILAEKIKTLSPGEKTAEPRCQYFGQCGGCQLQHIDYQEQISQKQQILQHFVTDKLNADIHVETFACPTPYHYRRRIRLRQQAGRVGFFKNKSLEFIPIDACPISVEPINHWLQDDNNFPRPDSKHDLSIDFNENTGIKTYEGKEQNEMGFQQANAWGETLLKQLIEDECKGSVEKGILELYCGAGGLVLSWFTPHLTQRYLGIDNDGVNIQSAIERYSQDNIHFVVGHLPEWLANKQLENQFFTDDFDVLVLDPARGGLGRSLKKLQRMPSINKWIYVSCNPTSWYKDIKTLQAKHGLQLKRAAMIDMFPQTRHFEIFSVLSASS